MLGCRSARMGADRQGKEKQKKNLRKGVDRDDTCGRMVTDREKQWESDKQRKLSNVPELATIHLIRSTRLGEL